MASLSDKLKQERELRGISLRQISNETKIGVRFLQALEDGKLELIPGEFYRRSYLRAYVRYLGLDEARTVNAYDYARRAAEAQASQPPAPRASEDGSRSARAPAELPFAGYGKPLAALAVLLVGVAMVWSAFGSNEETAEVNQADEVSRAPDSSDHQEATDRVYLAQAPSARAPGATRKLDTADRGELVSGAERFHEGREPGAQQGPERAFREVSSGFVGAEFLTAEAMKIRITVEEPCWLQIEADGRLITEGLKPIGFTQEVSADNEIRLWLGNAGGVSLWVNDRRGKPLGRTGQVRKDLQITPDNIEEYAAADLTGENE